MIKHSDHFHGSDLEKIEQVYGIAKDSIISFSANVNPLGISFLLRDKLALHIDAISTYPDREYTSLRKAIAAYANCEPECVLVGNGSTELISLSIQYLQPKKALILSPTYSEYEREILLSNGEVCYYPLKEELGFALDLEVFLEQLTSDLDLLVICNPNNPTSSCIEKKQMKKILDRCREAGIFLCVDETYIEFTACVEENTSVLLTKIYDNLIVLRGVSKFFAAPGLRLGYAVCGNERLIAKVNERKNPWTINSLAVVAGEIMFGDLDYIEKSRELIFSERKRVTDVLLKCGLFHVYRANANFVLLRILKDGVTAKDVFEMAIRKGLMIRNCDSFPFLDQRFLRVCFMRPEENNALLGVLLEV